MMIVQKPRGSFLGGVMVAGLAACLLSAPTARADVTVGVDPADLTLGYMNVSNLPAPDGDGGFQFGQPWGVADLTSMFSGGVLTLGPNTVGDPDPYWYIGGGAPGAPGNKIMEANLYNEVTGTYAGQTVTFAGVVLANTLTPAHTAVAFIKDFAPDYSSFNGTSVPLTPGAFSFDLAINVDPARHVQYGFTTTGVNVWVTDVGPFGTVEIAAVPEPSTLLLAGLGAVLLVRRMRRRQTA